MDCQRLMYMPTSSRKRMKLFYGLPRNIWYLCVNLDHLLLTIFMQAQAALESGQDDADDEDSVLKHIKKEVAAKVRQP